MQALLAISFCNIFQGSRTTRFVRTFSNNIINFDYVPFIFAKEGHIPLFKKDQMSRLYIDCRPLFAPHRFFVFVCASETEPTFLDSVLQKLIGSMLTKTEIHTLGNIISVANTLHFDLSSLKFRFKMKKYITVNAEYLANFILRFSIERHMNYFLVMISKFSNVLNTVTDTFTPSAS